MINHMQHRSKDADDIHKALMRYIDDHDKAKLDKFKQALKKASNAVLMECSINGYSILMDTVCLPYRRIDKDAKETKAKESKERIALSLFKCLMKVCRKLPEVKKFLLLTEDNSGLKPFGAVIKTKSVKIMRAYLKEVRKLEKDIYRQLLISTWPTYVLGEGNTDIIRSYFEVLRKARKKQIISKKDYRHLLIDDEFSFNVLQKAFEDNNPTHVRIVFDELLWALEQGILADADYRGLLIDQNKTYFTPLQTLLMAAASENLNEVSKAEKEEFINKTSENLMIYFKELMAAKKKEIISPVEYCDVLIKKNQGGLMPFDFLLQIKNPVIARIYFDAIRAGDFDKDYYYLCFFEPNAYGYAPINPLLKTGNLTLLRMYFSEIGWAYGKKIIKREVIIELLTKPNPGGVTPLQVAVESRDLKFLEGFVNILQKFLSPSALLFYLNIKIGPYRNKKLYCDSDTREGGDINRYLDSLRRELTEKPKRKFLDKDESTAESKEEKSHYKRSKTSSSSSSSTSSSGFFQKKEGSKKDYQQSKKGLNK